MHDTDQFKKDIHDDYDIEEELGSGQFAVVRKIVEKETGDEFAGKYVRKKRSKASRTGMSREDIKREIEILRLVDHDKIIKVHDVYETDREMILIMELLRGGELFDYISKKDFLTEEEAIDFTRQILQGLQHLHSKNVVHLDLKPENILLSSTRKKTIKLVDFGLARVVKENEQVREIMGTPEFVAPEVLNFDTISTATDMWALGVIAYILLSGASPFLGEDNQETFTNIIQVDYQFDEEYFSEISDEAKDFIKKLLIKDPRKRPTAHECSRHTWVEEVVVDKKKRQRRRTTQICTFNFKRFVARKRWKMSYNKIRAMNMIAKMGIKAPPGFITEIPPMPTTDVTTEVNEVKPPSPQKEPKEHKEHKKSSINRRKHKQNSVPKPKIEKTDSLTLKSMEIDIGESDTAGSGTDVSHSDSEHVKPSPSPEPKDYAAMSMREKRRARGQLRHDEIVKSKEEITAKKAKSDDEEGNEVMTTNELASNQEESLPTDEGKPEKPMDVDHKPVAKTTSGGILKKHDSKPPSGFVNDSRHEPHTGAPHGILKRNQKGSKVTEEHEGKPIETGDKPAEIVNEAVKIEGEQTMETVDKPVETVDKPVKNVDKPVETVDKPVKNMDKSVKNVDKPVETVDKPMKNVDKPVKNVKKTLKNVEKPVEPVEKSIEPEGKHLGKSGHGKLMSLKDKLEKPKEKLEKPKDKLKKTEDKLVKHKDKLMKLEDKLVKHKDKLVKHEDKPTGEPMQTDEKTVKTKAKPVEPEIKSLKLEGKPIDESTSKRDSTPPPPVALNVGTIAGTELKTEVGAPVTREIIPDSKIETTEMVVERKSGVSTTLNINKKAAKTTEQNSGKSFVRRQLSQEKFAKLQSTEQNKPVPKNGGGRPPAQKLSPSPWQNKSSKEKPSSKQGLQGLSKVSLKANRFMTNDTPSSPTTTSVTKTVVEKTKMVEKQNEVEINTKKAGTKMSNPSSEELKSVACEINLDETDEPKESSPNVETVEKKVGLKEKNLNEKTKNDIRLNNDQTKKPGKIIGNVADTSKSGRSWKGQAPNESAGERVVSVKAIPKTPSGSATTKSIVNGEKMRCNVKQGKSKELDDTTSHVTETKPVEKANEEDEMEELRSVSASSLTEVTIRPRQNSGGAKAGGFDIKLTVGAQPVEEPTRRQSLTITKIASSSSSSIDDSVVGSDGKLLTSVSAIDVTSHIREKAGGRRTSAHDANIGVTNGKLSSMSAVDMASHPHNQPQGKYVPQRDFSKYLQEPSKSPQTTGTASFHVKTQSASRSQPTFTVKRTNPAAQATAVKGKKPSVNTTVYVPRRTFGFSAKPAAQTEFVIQAVSEADDSAKINNNEQSKRWSQSSNASDRSASSASSEDTPVFRVKLQNNVQSELVHSTERLVNETNSANTVSQKIENCTSPVLSPHDSPVAERKWKATLVVPKECEKVPTTNENDVKVKATNLTKKHKFSNARSMFEGK